MSRHLLLLTLGPMQEFIAQARRTRDLWFGSHLLVEVSRAAARSLAKSGATLIFPATSTTSDLEPTHPDFKLDPELLPCEALVRPDGKPPLGITNRILAEIPEGKSPGELAKEAREAAKKRWEGLATEVQHRRRGLIASHTDEVWREQIETFLEIHAAFAPVEERDGGYVAAREAIEGALAGRKLLRDFSPWQKQRGGVPKSSLDGARETVLREPAERDPEQVKRYRIAVGEQLDAVGLVKRAGADPEQFIPIANVALAPWIEAAKLCAKERIEATVQACKSAGLSGVHRPKVKVGAIFAYDAEVFLESRWHSMLTESGYLTESKTKATALREAEQWGKTHVAPVFDLMRRPFPYVACLVADGDHMGDAIRKLGSRDRHQKFSRALSTFARDARTIVEQDHRGLLVYAGGDDVLAFVCLDDALSCANALQAAFSRIAKGAVSEDAPDDAAAPTLSVGLGVGHLMESMGELLDLGRLAERHAKVNRSEVEGESRNGLAILVDKRSGGRVAWRSRWDDPSGNPAERLLKDLTLESALSMKKVYEVKSDLRKAPRADALGDAEKDAWARVLAADVARTLARTGDGSGLTPEDVGLDLDPKQGYALLVARIEHWIDRMIVARTFEEAGRASTPRNQGKA